MENNILQEAYKSQLISNCMSYTDNGAAEAAISDINEMLAIYLSQVEGNNGHLGLNTNEFAKVAGLVIRVTGLVNFLTNMNLSAKNIRETNENNKPHLTGD